MDDKTPQEQYEIIQDAIYKAVDHIALEKNAPFGPPTNQITLKTDS
jgi:hypothetical protein